MDRGQFDPTGFVDDDPTSWPASPGGTLRTPEGAALTTPEGAVLTTVEPWYRPDDFWTVTADGTFQGLKLRAGGRLIAHQP